MSIVRKGWLRCDPSDKPIRVLADERGFIFGAGRGGWMIPAPTWKLNLLPACHEWRGWPHEEWWAKNWRRPEWAWIYGAP